MQTHTTAAKESGSQASKPFFGAQPARSGFFSPRPCGIQAKLSMGAPGDRFEREADSVADAVVQRMEAGRIARAATPTVQAACAACEEEKLQRQAEPGDDEMLQAKGADGATGVSASVEQQLQAGHAGHALAPALQARMEEAFQSDFSGVRVHTDGAAVQLNHDLHARAFTHGNDIYFNSGEFNPESRAGQHLLAHELTHVVQQSGSQASQIQRACGAAAIGAPAGCATSEPVFLEGYPTFKFKSDCDTFAAGEKAALVSHATSLPATASFEVHGFSKATGNAKFDQNLSCARALEAQRTLKDPLPFGANLPAARIGGVFAHGGTPGAPAAARSSVVVTPPRPAPLPAAMPVPAATDFAISRVGTSTTSRIFFAAGGATLTTADKTQLTKLKGTKPGSVRLLGFVSAGEADALAQSRADAVKAELTAAPDPVTVASAVGTPDAMKATNDFVNARSVEIVVGSAAATTLNCGAKDPKSGALLNPPQQDCSTLDPATQTAFNSSHPIAKDAMKLAVAAVAGKPDAVAEPLIDRFFGNHDAATLTALQTNLGALETNVKDLAKIMKCGGQCDTGRCAKGSVIAYHTQPKVKPQRMVLCVPVFRGLHVNDQARNLIHETAHGTSPLGGGVGKGTKDVAYRHERMMFHLSTPDRLRNSDSYSQFAMFLREARITKIPTAVPAGISSPATDSMPTITDPAENAAMKLALAVVEKRLAWAGQDLGHLYAAVAKMVGGGTSWKRGWHENLMKQAAQRFALTAPRAAPTVTDQTRLAAILDRYARMSRAMKQNLTVTKVASGGVTWPASSALIPGAALSVGPEFFRASARDQAGLVLEALALATSAVEPAFVPAYVSLAEWIHSQQK